MAYDLFVSYSRRDNREGRVTQLVERIKRDFAIFAKRDLVPFFDQYEIHGMEDWRHRILQGLRESRLLVACLSPAYLASEYCQWEFVEYLKYEIGHLHGFNGVAPIYFVQVPGWDDKDFDQKCTEWVADLRKRQNFDLRPWYGQGEEALREAAVRERLDALGKRIFETIQRAECAEKSLGNVDAHNPHFIGRTALLRQMRESFVKPGHIGLITAVNGLGGLGKTALAIEYAHAFADEYGGGRWQARCAGKDDLRIALADLATPIGFEFTDDEKKSADLQFDRVRRELKKLTASHTPHRCLLLLDNVDRPDLLAPAQVARLDAGDWLHVLATTRLGENELHGANHDRVFLPVDELPPDDALALIESYQPSSKFSRDAEENAAREIVRLLGCFTLAVESAAVYLGQFAGDVSCAAFLARLRKEGLEGLDTAASESTWGIRHGEKRLAATMAPTIQRLGDPERLALTYASLLPPDRIPLPWIRGLVADSYPEIGKNAEPGYPDPWLSLIRRLASLQLFHITEVTHNNQLPIVVRVHRLIQSLMRQTIQKDESIEGRFSALVSSIKIELLEGYTPGFRAWQRFNKKRTVSFALFGAYADETCEMSFQAFRSLSNDRMSKIVFDMHEFHDLEDLMRAFQLINATAESGDIPVVFWKNFDLRLGSDERGWLRMFLAPMQDGIAHIKGLRIQLAPALFVFSTIESDHLRDWSTQTATSKERREQFEEEFRTQKGPDFISRLYGYATLVPSFNDFPE